VSGELSAEALAADDDNQDKGDAVAAAAGKVSRRLIRRQDKIDRAW